MVRKANIKHKIIGRVKWNNLAGVKHNGRKLVIERRDDSSAKFALLILNTQAEDE